MLVYRTHLTNSFTQEVCEEGGYLEHQGYDISDTRAIIPKILSLLEACRKAGLQVYHTREGHRADLSDLSSRALTRSRNNPSGIGIGDQGPLGRLLVRDEPGHEIVRELYPKDGEPVIDKPGNGAFAYTDFELLLHLKAIRNLIVCGVTTDVCVHTTMREANDRGYDCLLVEDCCAASEEKLHRAAVEMVRTESGIFGATAELENVLNAVNVHTNA
jgi:nicotinamidase-related amidase